MTAKEVREKYTKEERAKIQKDLEKKLGPYGFVPLSSSYIPFKMELWLNKDTRIVVDFSTINPEKYIEHAFKAIYANGYRNGKNDTQEKVRTLMAQAMGVKSLGMV